MNHPCLHKKLTKKIEPMSQTVWYQCECGQKFKAHPWDGKVKVIK